MNTLNLRKEFLKTDSPKALFALNAVLALAYFCVLAFYFKHGNPVLYGLLIGGEVFHLWQVFTFLYTVWDTNYKAPFDAVHAPAVDIFITVAGEPASVVEETARAAQALRYRGTHEVYLLNDGYVAQKDNWQDIEALARRLGVHCITRTVQGGAKAGNINNALALTRAPLVAIFDADHVPHEDFLEKTAGYFCDARMGFVQTPQFYKNYAKNYLTQASWEQQELFFGAICKGKNRLNAATMCGTNMLIARQALVEVGGMSTESIAEDFVTGLFMHERGYKSYFVPEVLAEGLATEDFLSYTKQQFRWARGSLDVIFRYNPLLRRGLTFAQRIEYLASASFYLSGLVVFIDLMLPLAFLYLGLVPLQISGMLLAAVFLPYMFITLYCVQRASNFTFTFPSLALSMSAFTIHLQALYAAVTGQKSAFVVTPKEAVSGNFTRLATVHLAYIGLALLGVAVALVREGVSASLINNAAWVALNAAVFTPYIKAARGAHRAALPTLADERYAPPAPAPAQAYVR
jgi:cellulose synthase (UDP-forming)